YRSASRTNASTGSPSQPTMARTPSTSIRPPRRARRSVASLTRPFARPAPRRARAHPGAARLLAEVGVDAGHAQGAVADGEGAALGRPAPHVAGGEHAGSGGLQLAGLASRRPQR